MRLSSRAVVAALRHLGFEVSAGALRQWRNRGHIGPGPGYDVEEIATYLHSRVGSRRAVLTSVITGCNTSA